MVITYDNAAYVFIDGINEQYNHLNANYLLKWYMIQDYNSRGFKYINLNAIRIYANLGGRIPLANSNPRTLSFSGNIDFLLNLKIFHIYAGLGYGSEYYTSQKFFSQGLNINLGLSKQLGRGAIDVGLAIPFYTIYTKDVIIKNNIIFLLEYSYKI